MKHLGWQRNKGVARAILADRRERRKAMAWLLALVMIVFSAGLWLIDGWLAENIFRYALWWGLCALLTLLLMISAVYDAVKVLREERGG